MGKGKEMIAFRELKEKAVSKQQQKLMGLALAYKRGDVPDAEVSDTVRDLAKSMSTKELEKFAGTKHKGLPDKVDEDGHTDVDSSERMCKTVMEDAKEILEYLDDMEGEGSLPTWWTNKLATASKDMNSLRDYLVNPDDKKDVEEAVEIDARTKTFKETMKRLNAGKKKKEDASKKMTSLEFGTTELRDRYASMTPGQTEVKEAKTSGIDNAAAAIVTGALGAVGLGAKKGIGKLAKKAKDRLDPVKVAAARRERDQRKREKEKAQREIDQRKRERARKRTQAVTNTARKAGQTLGNLKKKISGNPPRRPAG